MFKNLLRRFSEAVEVLFGDARPARSETSLPPVAPVRRPGPIAIKTEIWLDTMNILHLLRTQNGEVRAPAGAGKSTALLLFANELSARGSVTILTGNSLMAECLKHLSDTLFGQLLNVCISSNMRDLRGVDFILIDEPACLSSQQRDELRGFHSRIAGAVERTYSPTIFNDRESFRANNSGRYAR